MDLNKLFDLDGIENPMLRARTEIPEVLEYGLSQGSQSFQLVISAELAKLLINDLRFAIHHHPKGVPDDTP